jgi:hypothetical protein
VCRVVTVLGRPPDSLRAGGGGTSAPGETAGSSK